MAEYIEREALREILDRWRDAHADVDDVHGCGLLEDVICEVDAQTIVDVAPVVHGRWILEREPNGKPYCFHCSVCDSDYHCIGIVVASDYCPNCGAKMDGGVDHEEATTLQVWPA